jgi:putative transposase
MNYTYRIYPDASQQAQMLAWLESCRRVYNYALRELKDWMNSRKCMVDRCSVEKEYIISADAPFPGYMEQKRQLPVLKETWTGLKDVHSQVLQDVIKRLHNTWENFRKRDFGFPRFKKYGQFKSFLFPQFKESPIIGHTRCAASVYGYQIKLPKIGLVPITRHRPIPDGFAIKQVRVLSRCRGTQWYVVVTIQSDVSVPDVPVHGRAIGIDLGLERFITSSDGSYVERPKFFKSLQSRLKVLQRRAARKQKRSKNWEKAQIEVSKLHHHIANRRKDFHLKSAHKLCDQAQTIFAENLNSVGLNRGMLRKECVDASFGAFLSLLEWVCWKRGVYFEKVNPHGTSQTCPNCQAAVSKTLEDRVHNCHECGYSTHRDHAAAQMVLIRGVDNVVPVDDGEWKPPGNAVLSGALTLDKWLSRNAQQ